MLFVSSRQYGAALLIVVMVLASLLVIGVMFSLTISVQVKTNCQYREHVETETAAQIAVHRLMSELQYNVWGANEQRAFTCADGTPLGVPLGKPTGRYGHGTYVESDAAQPPTAYVKSRWDDSTGTVEPLPLDRPWSRHVQSVVSLDFGEQLLEYDAAEKKYIGKANPYFNTFSTFNGAENDYRWLVSADVWGGVNSGVVADRLLDARNDDPTTPYNPRAVYSGGLYHDEFLPTGLSNADAWETAVHYNHGALFGRTFSNLSDPPAFASTGEPVGDFGVAEADPRNASYWSRAHTADGHPADGRSQLEAPDFFDPRMVGDSFHRIFRYDLVDRLDFKVRGTGVDPDQPGRYFSDLEIYGRTAFAKYADGSRINRATHLGDAGGNEKTVADPLGNAVNPNQVNLNFAFEQYAGPGNRFHVGSLTHHHYNESKWIYLYRDDDPTRPGWARFAAYVWSDAGLPNVNCLPTRLNALSSRDKVNRNNAVCKMRTLRTGILNVFTALDAGVTESGWSSTALYGGEFLDDGTFFVEEADAGTAKAMGQVSCGRPKMLADFVPADSAADWYDWYEDFPEWKNRSRGHAAFGLHLAEMADWHRWRNGPYASRAELAMVLRKNAFQDSDAELRERRDECAQGQKKLGAKAVVKNVSPSPNEMRLHDAALLAHHFSVHSYEYLLDPHWEQDRLVFDGFSHEDWLLAANKPPSGTSAWRRPSLALSPFVGGGYCDVNDDPQAARQTRLRLFTILDSLKDFHGIRSAATFFEPAQPGLPIPVFGGDYAATTDHLSSYEHCGPKQALRAKAHFLSQILNSTYVSEVNYAAFKWTHLTRFAVDADDPAGTPVPNLTPHKLLFGGKNYVLDRVWGPRLSEVGCGVFTLPAGPKLLDFDFADAAGQTLHPAHVDLDPVMGTERWTASLKHALNPKDPDFDRRYPFESKAVNFIEITGTSLPTTFAGAQWFLRVYGNVRNWDGEIYGEDLDGDGLPDRLTTDPQPADESNHFSGGQGYVDLFARVKRKLVKAGEDKNGDGDFWDEDDAPPVYTVDQSVYGWINEVFYDPYHYLEGVVIRYFSGQKYPNAQKTEERYGEYYEDLVEWISAGKALGLQEKDQGKPPVELTRSWDNLSIGGLISAVNAIEEMKRAENELFYRFGSYAAYPVPDNDYAQNANRPNAAPVIGDPDWGLTPVAGGHPAAYLLVLFPHARTPWTRRLACVEARTEKLDERAARAKFGLGHFDDQTAYPDVSESSPRTSNYADGDAVVLGYFQDDGFKRHALSRPALEYKNQPRVVTHIKLNGKHPDFAELGGKAGPACRFARVNATVSGGTFIVKRDGSVLAVDCLETLPNNLTQSFSSSAGAGFAAADPRNNLDPWAWAATGWDWENDRALPFDARRPRTANRQSPALTAYDSRIIGWENTALPQTSDGLGKGRFDRHVHGVNAGDIMTQLNQTDPQMGRAEPSGDERGKFPFPIFTHFAARVGQSSAAVLLRERLSQVQLTPENTRPVVHFNDRLWLRHVALNTGDLRLRDWWELCLRSRADEYFETDGMNPILGSINPAYGTVRDFLDNNMTGAGERLTSQPLWQAGNPLGAPLGRYFADRKTVKRINLNQITAPAVVAGLFSVADGSAKDKYSEATATDFYGGGTIAPLSLIAQKPLRGFTYVNAWSRRCGNLTASRKATVWNDNLWADGSADLYARHNGTPEYYEKTRWDEEGWAAFASVAPAPVYTAFVLAQRLGEDGQPLGEMKLQLTLERTWDGKMNVLEYGVCLED